MAGVQETLQYDTEVGKEGGGRWEARFHVCMLTANILEAQCRRLLLKAGLRRGDVVARNGAELQRSELEFLQSLSMPGNRSCGHHPVKGLIWILWSWEGGLEGPKLNLVEDEEQEFMPQTGV